MCYRLEHPSRQRAQQAEDTRKPVEQKTEPMQAERKPPQPERVEEPREAELEA